MTHNIRQSKKIIDYDPRFNPILSEMGLEQIRVVLRLTPDPELITTLIERWRLETNTFHLYHGEATITLEDIHFITGLSIDSLPDGFEDHSPATYPVHRVVTPLLCFFIVQWHRPNRVLRQFGMDQPIPTFDIPRSEVNRNMEIT
ncbi:Protein MAIN-LIKE 2 [Linum perenne]